LTVVDTFCIYVGELRKLKDTHQKKLKRHPSERERNMTHDNVLKPERNSPDVRMGRGQTPDCPEKAWFGFP
jgi:hypothetical protein